jgi:hypothetical protein
MAVFFLTAMLSCPSIAAAGQQAVSSDDDAASAQGSQGPLVLKPIKPAGLLAIDAKVTQINGGTGTLAGAYGGRLFDDALLIGAGGYGLTKQVGGVNMGYGGFLVGWQTNGNQGFSVGIKGLLGGGQATVPISGVTFVPVAYYPPCLPGLPPAGSGPCGISSSSIQPTVRPISYRYSTNFLIAEPQLDVILGTKSRVRLDIGAGYRAIGQSGGVDRQLRGATGSVSIQFKIGG